MVALSRMSQDERTRNYVDKRTAEGKTKREIIRCLSPHLLIAPRSLTDFGALTSIEASSVSGSTSSSDDLGWPSPTCWDGDLTIHTKRIRA